MPDRQTAIHPSKAEFDHHDRATMQDPYAFFAHVRDTCPIARSDKHGGFFFATTFDAVRSIYANFRDFTSTEGDSIPRQLMTLLPVDLDPPTHTRWRKVLNPFFTPEVAAADRPRIEAIATELIDRFVERGEADAARELAQPVTALVMLPILGVPEEDRAEIANALDYMAHHRTDDPAGWQERSIYVATSLTCLAAGRRSQPRRNDLLQALIEVPIEGKRLTDDEIFRVLFVTLLGALDTTQSVLTQAILHLARHPEDRRRLAEDSASWPNAIEEFIRFATPIQALSRTIARDVELCGCPLPAGQRVVALNGAANRDPARFDRADECLIDRPMTEHMAFGAGAHICIGRHYARVMIEVVLKAVLRQLPDFDVSADFVPEFVAGEARAMKRLPIFFTPHGAPSRR